MGELSSREAGSSLRGEASCAVISYPDGVASQCWSTKRPTAHMQSHHTARSRSASCRTDKNYSRVSGLSVCASVRLSDCPVNATHNTAHRLPAPVVCQVSKGSASVPSALKLSDSRGECPVRRGLRRRPGRAFLDTYGVEHSTVLCELFRQLSRSGRARRLSVRPSCETRLRRQSAARVPPWPTSSAQRSQPRRLR